METGVYSIELTKHYLGYNASQKIKDDFLESFVSEQQPSLIRLMVDSGGHIQYVARNCLERFSDEITIEYKLLYDTGYDFNWQDDKGNTLLMLHAKCWADDTSNELITILQFLIDHGARTDIKNKDGKTAYELAVNSKAKAFLAQFNKQ